ncbi:MAG: beta-N-acetylhexosaminidase [Bacteroidales bacterium]|nr:beta-N-acetylhexosaminidase [Bacteroidales bacterium]
MKLLTFLLAAFLPIIPYPQEVELTKGSFNPKGAPFTCDSSIGEKEYAQLALLADNLSNCCGKRSSIAPTIRLKATVDAGQARGFVFLKDGGIPAEGYVIEVSRKAVTVRFPDYKGLLNSIQTLKQIMPVCIYTGAPTDGIRWEIPCCTIKDAPRFGWRGMHLDCSRHFFPVEEVKKYLDVMAMYKLNKFHWHLTDDQGWRLEIEKYPRLTETGGFRDGTCIAKDMDSNDGIRYGGFYTKEQIREVIAYAANLGIEVVPEIDLPGHMRAALAAYPEFGCTGGPYTVWTSWGVAQEVLCPGKEGTMQFLEDVLSEVADLFPCEYIHVGGDECPKDEWKKCPDCQARIAELGLKDTKKATKEQYLQNYVTARMQQVLGSKGKKLIGWEEIMEGELAPGATVMSWKDGKLGAEAVRKGFDVVMTPYEHCYFDFAQSDSKDEPLGGWGTLPLKKVYEFNPTRGFTDEEAGHILGAQANLWTEYIPTSEHLEYMLLPRLQALSEAQWCSNGAKDWQRFRASLEIHLGILDLLGYNYRKPDR